MCKLLIRSFVTSQLSYALFGELQSSRVPTAPCWKENELDTEPLLWAD